jgi:hypothetical protein
MRVCGVRPKYSVTLRRTSGTRVDPPTRMRSLSTVAPNPAEISTSWQPTTLRSMYGAIIASNSARVMSKSRETGLPPGPTARSWIVPAAASSSDRTHLICSHAVVKRDQASRLSRRSMRCFSMNSPASQLTSTRSKSSPPRNESPPVASTSKILSRICRTVTSNVPPPRS